MGETQMGSTFSRINEAMRANPSMRSKPCPGPSFANATSNSKATSTNFPLASRSNSVWSWRSPTSDKRFKGDGVNMPTPKLSAFTIRGMGKVSVSSRCLSVTTAYQTSSPVALSKALRALQNPPCRNALTSNSRVWICCSALYSLSKALPTLETLVLSLANPTRCSACWPW